MDIATSLKHLADSIINMSRFQKALMVSPFLITPAVTASQITSSVAPQGLRVSYINLKVRSMGTATYIGIGDAQSQTDRMTVAGEIWEAEAPRGAYLDTRQFYIIADVADAVIEVGAVLIPGEN